MYFITEINNFNNLYTKMIIFKIKLWRSILQTLQIYFNEYCSCSHSQRECVMMLGHSNCVENKNNILTTTHATTVATSICDFLLYKTARIVIYYMTS